MAREKKNVHKVQMTDGKRQIIQQLVFCKPLLEKVAK